jgi:hypothetical protein
MRFGAIAAVLALLVSASAMRAEDETDPTAEALITCAPKSYETALDCLDAHLTQEIKTGLNETDGVAIAHFGLGMWIRNNWGLWKDGPLAADMRRLGFTHPDDMSATILEGLVARMKGEPYDLAAEAQDYRAYWEGAEQDQKFLEQACQTGQKIPVGDGRVAVCEKMQDTNVMYFEEQESN